MFLARRHDCFRRPLDQVVHDRKVVWRQVPHHICVGLEHAEIDSCGVVVVERSERVVVDQLADLAHRAREQECVIHHDLEILPVCQLNELLRFVGAAGEWFLDEDVFPIFKRRPGHWEVQGRRSDNGDGVNLRG